MTSTTPPKNPSDEFKTYCEIELEHRRNSGKIFDEELYSAAINLVLRNLIRIEEEGQV